MSEVIRQNIMKLMELKSQLEHFAAVVEDILGCNVRADTKSKLKQAVSMQSTGKTSLAQQVRELLLLAGSHGTTTEELVHLLSQKRPVQPNTVRTALRRMRDAGGARNTGRRWYSTP